MKWRNKENMDPLCPLILSAFLFDLFCFCESDVSANKFVSREVGLNDQTVVPNQFGSFFTLQPSKKKSEVESRFAAEWEYILSSPSFEPSSTSTPIPTVTKSTGKNPSRRMAPATWNDQQGNWYIFGGYQSSSDTTPSRFFSDLWKYSFKEEAWKFIFKPEDLTQQQTSKNFTANLFTSAFPENLSFPLLCGSKNSRRFAVHGVVGGNIKSINSGVVEASSTESSPFTEDNIIWLYDVSESSSQSPSWTSYVCCDACLPDGNSTSNIDFCPQFNKETLSWCDHSGIMMLQPGSIMSLPIRKGEDYSTASTTFLGASESESGSAEGLMNWWKFDVESTEWVKLPPVSIDAIDDASTIQDLLQTGICRVVKADSVVDEIVYILCSKQSLLEPSVIVFDPARGSLSLLGSIQLNNAFADNELWHPARSTLHAVQLPESNATVILIAYQKLLDIWIHDHSQGTVSPLENVWKGKALRAFQTQQDFYELSISMESSPEIVHKFYMVNPRYRFAEFSRSTKATFKVTIVSDQEVFLPQRDAAALIQSIVKEKTDSPENPEKNLFKENVTVVPTSHVTTLDNMTTIQGDKFKNEIHSRKRPAIQQSALSSNSSTSESTASPWDVEKAEAHNITYSQHASQSKPTTTDIIAITTSPPYPFNVTTGEILSSSVESLGSKTHNFNEPQEGTTTSYKYQQSDTTQRNVQQSTTRSTISVSSLTRRPKKVIPGKKLPSLMNTLMKTDMGGNKREAKGSKSFDGSSTSTTTTIDSMETLIEHGSEAVLSTTRSPTKLSLAMNSTRNNVSRESTDLIKSFRQSGGNRVEKIKLEAAKGEIHDDHYVRDPGNIVLKARMDVAEESRVERNLPGNTRQNRLYGEESSSVSEFLVDPTIFFAMTLSFFASMGVILFVRGCVKCPPIVVEQPSVLIKESRPNRYVSMPTECSLHTPIV